MEKKVLLYNSNRAHPAMWHNMMSLAEGFQQIGIRTILCDLENRDSTNYAYQMLLETDEIAFSVGFNDIGMWILDSDGVSKIPVYENFGTPHVSILLDVPYNPYTRGYAVPCQNHLITVLDRRNSDYLRLRYPDFSKHTLFLPLGGTGNQSLKDIIHAKRPYDLVVCENFWPLRNTQRKWKEGTCSPQISRLLDETLEVLQQNPCNVFSALEFVLQQHGFYEEEYLQRMLPWCEALLLIIKPWRRSEAVKRLIELGIPIDIFGEGWEHTSNARNLRLHGAVSYEETLAIFSQAKIVFQDEAEFNDGAHDRVFTAMLNGAVVVSEHSKYLDEIFVNGQDMILYDWKINCEAMQQILGILSDDTQRLTMMMQAYQKTDQNHRWRNRAEKIKTACDMLFFKNG